MSRQRVIRYTIMLVSPVGMNARPTLCISDLVRYTGALFEESHDPLSGLCCYESSEQGHNKRMQKNIKRSLLLKSAVVLFRRINEDQ